MSKHIEAPPDVLCIRLLILISHRDKPAEGGKPSPKAEITDESTEKKFGPLDGFLQISNGLAKGARSAREC